MTQTIANPIYDAVFKYLVEDERIARTLLSALLRKEVVEVEMRPHEYSNETKDNKISMFRVDFAARVRENDGTEHLVLVELQKTWIETETLRFRRYLGAQYNNKRNIEGEGRGEFALPMVAIYLLGHRVGDIEEPVVYFNHQATDYNGNLVTRGMPDPFVESLQHDSIIVQIPLLRGQVSNRLYRVLSVFDQSKADAYDKQVIKVDADAYDGDADMQYIVRRLTAAAADTRLREDMNVEDEFYSAIENRDTAIMNRDKTIARQDLKIAQQGEQLAQQGEQLAQQGEQLAQQGEQLAQQGEQLAQQNEQLAQQNEQLAQQKDLLRNMIKAMMRQGLTVETIATMVGLTTEEVKKYV